MRFITHSILLMGIGLLFGVSNINVQNFERSVAVLEINNEQTGNPDLAKTLSVRYMAEVAGVPFEITQNFERAIEHSVLIATEGFNETNLSNVERDILRNYVDNGGVLISPNFKDSNLFDVFGIHNEEYSRSRKSITFEVDEFDQIYQLFNEPREEQVPLGSQSTENVILSRAYFQDGAEILATFDDGNPAITRNSYGEGYAYAIGISFRDVIVRNQLGLDFSANRDYSNAFEPGADVYSLMLRGIFAEHIPFLVWKHTSPSNTSSSVILTHDVDSESSMKVMNRFAEFQNGRGITATYFITTHYIHDALDGDYYTAYRDSIAKLDEQGQNIGSHAVGHFPDFDNLPVGNLGETKSSYNPTHSNGETQGATLAGELEVSKNLLSQDASQDQKIQSFRAPHLLFHDKLINMLDTLDYKYNSTFSANNIMTSFPYYSLKDRSFSGEETGLLEIPLTISDVIDGEFDGNNYEEVVSLWLEVTKKYDANSSPTVLLIHPNRDYKLRALKNYLDRLPPDMGIESIESFGQFWNQRNKVRFESYLENNTLNIHLLNKVPEFNRISFKIENGMELDEVHVYDTEGSQLSLQSEQSDNGSLLVYTMQESDETSESDSLPKPVVLYPNYPNPFSGTTTIPYDLKEDSNVTLEIYTILGEKIVVLVDEDREKGPHWVDFNAENLSSGIYLYKLKVNSYVGTGKLTLIK
ncbi:T9SS type A sorting domain-containing protein [Aliifodinibius salicampi]|uniref:T9SS type A sorting domain-containing protein n=1 Tax=Fodinibius salicampi TaxID=1920655 RepID=A0ABT3PUU8_9BACT|nr:T9SS type A sorting domain-containing protein [Fodinibius salicampi]MCW9711629.1 T9SS type A sorting domain-containing protein [Fodinibius salicampi]